MFSKSGTHAVRALMELAVLPKGSHLGATALAEITGAPSNYLGKLLQTLTKAGLVDSRRGLGGGFRLAKNPAKISLYDVVDPIDHLSRWEGCILAMGKCSDRTACPVHTKWGKVREDYMEFLHSTTIAEMIAADHHDH